MELSIIRNDLLLDGHCGDMRCLTVKMAIDHTPRNTRWCVCATRIQIGWAICSAGVLSFINSEYEYFAAVTPDRIPSP